MEKESDMNKNEFISQLTSLVEDYTEGLRSANNKLFHSGQRLTAEKQEWEQKYHSAMAANKRLDEQNEGLRVEKLALRDVVSEWKKENQSLNALNATLSGELQELKERCASQYQDFLKQEQIEALTVWKTGAESVLDTLEAKLKDAKDVIHTQENTIEWLNGRANWLDEKVKRLKAKKAKKEQND
jgi:chromosome segregation ATPase